MVLLSRAQEEADPNTEGVPYPAMSGGRRLA
jgi:hypothetical protein